AERVDPYRAFNFVVEIDKLSSPIGFSDCSGFAASNDPIEYREGGENTFVRKLPGLTKYSNIVLKRGLTDNHDLFDWFKDITAGKIDRRNGSIVALDLDGTEKVRWNFTSAWPTKYDAPDFSAKGNDIAIDSFELAIEKLERVS